MTTASGRDDRGTRKELPPMPASWRFGAWGAVVLCGTFAWFARDGIGPRGVAACGIACFVGVVAACSKNLRAVNWRTVGWGFALQVLLALFILKFQLPGRPEGMSLGPYLGHVATFSDTGAEPFRPGFALFQAVGTVIGKFLDFASAGSTFVFGDLADKAETGRVFPKRGGFVFAFMALPTIVFVSSFFTVLYYLGVLQWIVRITARGMVHLLRTSGAETLSAVANVFMGQTEAPLIVKPYVVRMTQSELLALMAGGMATISGGVMAVYIQMGADPVAILATSVMAAPCGLYLSKLLLPETETTATGSAAPASNATASPGESAAAKEPDDGPVHRNVIDAAAAGASDGMHLALNVAAMLIAFLAFIALFDALADFLYGGLSPSINDGLRAVAVRMSWLEWWMIPWLDSWPETMSLARIFSWLFAPVAFLMGADPSDVPALADLLGTKLVANEFVSYVKLTSPASAGGYHDVVSPRGYVLATYALTGFANLSSIGIQLGGIGALAPSRRAELAALGGRALLVGFLATLINASVAGMLSH